MRVLISHTDNLIFIDGVAKRLPVSQRSDAEFRAIHWNGDTGEGLVELEDEPSLLFTDPAIAQPFIDMWDVEPPQDAAGSIGARRQIDPEDDRWRDILARHPEAISVSDAIEALRQQVEEQKLSREEAARQRELEWQQQMNAKRRALGKAEIDYAGRR